MIRRLFRWLSSLLLTFRYNEANGIALDWSRDANRLRRRIEKHIKKLKSLERKLVDIGDTIVEDLEEADHIVRRHEEATDGLQSELTILKELTVPGLTKAHQLMVQRAEADTAVQVRKQVTYSAQEE